MSALHLAQAQMSPARLTAAIQQQATLAGLQALLSRHSSLVNAIHVAAALQWLVSHPQQQPQAPDQLSQLVQQWVALVAVKQESARSCVSLIYSCSRLGVVQEVGLYTPLLQRFMEVKQEADARMLSNLLYALGSRPQLKGLLQPPVLVALLQQLNQVAHTAIPQALANALWSAAKVEQPPGDSSRLLREVVAQLLGKFLNILQEAQPQDVSNTLYALALLPQAWPMDSALQLVEKMVVLLPQARPQAASNVLWALGWYVEQGWLKPLGGVPDAGLQAAVDQLLSHLAAAGGGVKPQEVSNSLWAAAVLQAQVDWRVVGRLMESVSRGRPAPQALSNAAWAVATLQQLLDASSPAQYVNQQQQQVWQRPFSRAAQVFATLLPQASQQEIANMVWACGVVRHYPQQLLQALTAAAAPPPQLAQATPQAVANLAWALAVLAPEPPPTTLLASLLQRVQELLAQQQPCGIGSQELANTAWALAVLDQQQLASKLIPLAAAAFSPQHWGSVRREGLLQWHQVQLWLTDTQALGPAGLGEVPGVTQQQLEACAAAWEEQLVRQVSPSGVQREVAQVRIGCLCWLCSNLHCKYLVQAACCGGVQVAVHCTCTAATLTSAPGSRQDHLAGSLAACPGGLLMAPAGCSCMAESPAHMTSTLHCHSVHAVNAWPHPQHHVMCMNVCPPAPAATCPGFDQYAGCGGRWCGATGCSRRQPQHRHCGALPEPAAGGGGGWAGTLHLAGAESHRGHPST
jgi:hypothetical protein